MGPIRAFPAIAKSSPARAGLALLAIVGLAACVSVDREEPLLSDLKADIARCDSAHGPVARRQPAAERAWRACVHHAARQLLLPAVRLPDVYRLLLVEDVRLTDDVLAGRLGPERRAARLRELANRIDLVEGGEPLAKTRKTAGPYSPTVEEIIEARTYLVEVLSR